MNKWLKKTSLLTKIGFIIIVFWIIVAIFAPLITPYGANVIDTSSKLIPPSKEHWFGTDNFGRDIFSRIIYGARITIWTGALAVAIAASIGVLLGAIAGFYQGIIGNIIMRVMDMLLAFPSLILAMAISAAIGKGLIGALIAVGVVGIPEFARLMYSQTLVIKEKEFILASHAIGVSSVNILRKHILPNAIGPLLVQISLSLGSAILTTSSLSFIGLGIQPPSPEWGAMISYGRDYIVSGEWWMTTFPGLAIALTIFAFIALGDGLTELLQPSQQKKIKWHKLKGIRK